MGSRKNCRVPSCGKRLSSTKTSPRFGFVENQSPAGVCRSMQTSSPLFPVALCEVNPFSDHACRRFPRDIFSPSVRGDAPARKAKLQRFDEDRDGILGFAEFSGVKNRTCWASEENLCLTSCGSVMNDRRKRGRWTFATGPSDRPKKNEAPNGLLFRAALQLLFLFLHQLIVFRSRRSPPIRPAVWPSSLYD
jgi:hypothetical protein